MIKHIFFPFFKIFSYFIKDRIKIKGRGFGFVKSNKDKRDFCYPLTTVNLLNSTIDLRRSNERNKCQGNLGTCYAFAVSDWYEHEVKGMIDVSEMFLSYRMREYYGDIGKPGLSFPNDKGACIRDVFQQMRKGDMITAETFCPYNIFEFNSKPNNWAYAMSHIISSRIKTYWRIYDESQVSNALHDGHRIVLGLKLDTNFLSSTERVINKIDANKAVYGHAMTIVGQEGDYYVIKNWWGSHPSFVKIKKSVVLNPKLLIEMWTAKLK